MKRLLGILGLCLCLCAPASAAGIWTTSEEIAEIPTTGAEWTQLANLAAEDFSGEIQVECAVNAGACEQDSARAMAKAILYVRDPYTYADYRTQVRTGIGTSTTAGKLMDYTETEQDETDQILSVCREIGGWVIAADLVGLESGPDSDFRTWLAGMRTTVVDQGADARRETITMTQERQPNNWGLHCGFSRVVIDLYLGDTTDLTAAVNVFKSYLGEDVTTYNNCEFEFGGTVPHNHTWEFSLGSCTDPDCDGTDPCNPNKAIGINPLGATLSGHDVDGVLPDDQRRAGQFDWPPPTTIYSWGGLQGVIDTAYVLHRAGYTEVWDWADSAIQRAVTWLYETADDPAVGDDEYLVPIINKYHGTSYTYSAPADQGKAMGFTGWTLSEAAPGCDCSYCCQDWIYEACRNASATVESWQYNGACTGACTDQWDESWYVNACQDDECNGAQEGDPVWFAPDFGDCDGIESFTITTTDIWNCTHDISRCPEQR